MSNVTLPQALDMLKAADSFLLTSHVSPDGDAVGSMLSLYHLLRALNKENVHCVMHDAVPRMYIDLAGADAVKRPSDAFGPRELVVITDVAQLERIGEVSKLIGPDDSILVLDHHLEEEPCGTANFVDPTYASASEIIVDLFVEAGIDIPRDAAECAYVGLVTDTGGFRFSNTRPESHLRAARLLDAGIDVSGISSRLFETMTGSKFALLRAVLRNTEVDASGRYAFTTITLKEMEEAGANPEDLDGLVNYTRNIEGVDVGMLLREVDGGSVKVSMRSGADFNSAKVLQLFGGGGHAAAAGATLEGPLDRARGRILNEVRRALREGSGDADGS